jgi:hypothetical protein
MLQQLSKNLSTIFNKKDLLIASHFYKVLILKNYHQASGTNEAAVNTCPTANAVAPVT